MSFFDLIGLILGGLLCITVIVAVGSVFVTEFQSQAWFGHAPRLREQVRLRLGRPSDDMAARLVAREVLRAYPHHTKLARREMRTLMKTLTGETHEYLTSHEFPYEPAVVARWIHRHGLASFEEHLTAGYTNTELSQCLDAKQVPDPTNTEFLVAMSPQFGESPWPLHRRLEGMSDYVVRKRYR